MSGLKMTSKEFHRVTKRDFENGAVRNEISNALKDREALLAENKRLRDLLNKTAEAFRGNNRELTANQCNAWEAIEKELGPKPSCICRSYFMRTHEHIPGCPALKEID